MQILLGKIALVTLLIVGVSLVVITSRSGFTGIARMAVTAVIVEGIEISSQVGQAVSNASSSSRKDWSILA